MAGYTDSKFPSLPKETPVEEGQVRWNRRGDFYLVEGKRLGRTGQFFGRWWVRGCDISNSIWMEMWTTNDLKTLWVLEGGMKAVDRWYGKNRNPIRSGQTTAKSLKEQGAP